MQYSNQTKKRYILPLKIIRQTSPIVKIHSWKEVAPPFFLRLCSQETFLFKSDYSLTTYKNENHDKNSALEQYP